jgi:hypothetical protein
VTQNAIDRVFGGPKCVNTWWPTELTGPNTGAGSGTVPFAYPMKRDSSTYPLPYVKQDVMIVPIKTGDQHLDRLQVFIVLNQGHALDSRMRAQFDDLVTGKKQRTFNALMTEGADYFPVEMYPVTMSQKSLRRFGAMLGSLDNEQLAAIVQPLEDPDIRLKVANGDGTVIHNVFPSKKDQNPYAGSLVGLGNYPSLVHMTYAVAKAKGIKLKVERSCDG